MLLIDHTSSVYSKVRHLRLWRLHFTHCWQSCSTVYCELGTIFTSPELRTNPLTWEVPGTACQWQNLMRCGSHSSHKFMTMNTWQSDTVLPKSSDKVASTDTAVSTQMAAGPEAATSKHLSAGSHVTVAWGLQLLGLVPRLWLAHPSQGSETKWIVGVSLILFHALTFQVPPSYKCYLPLQGPYSSNVFSGLVFLRSDEESAHVAAGGGGGFLLHPLSFYCRQQYVLIKSTCSLCWIWDDILATCLGSNSLGSWGGVKRLHG